METKQINKIVCFIFSRIRLNLFYSTEWSSKNSTRVTRRKWIYPWSNLLSNLPFISRVACHRREHGRKIYQTFSTAIGCNRVAAGPGAYVSAVRAYASSSSNSFSTWWVDIKKVALYLVEIVRVPGWGECGPAVVGSRITKSNTYVGSAFVGSRWIKVSSRIVLAENDRAASFDAWIM